MTEGQDMEGLYTMREVADHLRVSIATLRRQMQAGRIDYIRIGRQVRFTRGAVEAVKGGGGGDEA